MSSELFLQYVLRWEKHVRDNLAVPQNQALVLLLDSGGGNLCHLSPDFTVACEARNIRPVFFPPYGTAAVCCLDQTPNCQCELAWERSRCSSESLTQLQALDIAHEAWDVAYTEKYILSGWREVGLVPGKAVNRSKVLGERADNLFRSTIPQTELVPKTRAGEAVLERPCGYKRAPARAQCASCGSRTPTSLPRCGYCGEKNQDYDEVADSVQNGLKHGGYSKKQPAVFDVEAAVSTVEPGQKASLARWSGDLMGEMRRRKAAAACDGEPAAKKPAVAAAPAVPTEAKQQHEPKPEAEPEPGSDTEFDLDSADGVASYIAAHFDAEQQPEILKIAHFYVQSKLKPLVRKDVPLSLVYKKEMKDILQSAKGRKAWESSWAQNRRQRFVKMPVVKTK